MNWLIENLFWIPFLVIPGYLLFRMIRYGGVKAAMFGAKIEKTLGEVEGHPQRPVSLRLKVHVLDGGSSDKAVGLELIAKSFASYQMMPVTLSVVEAKKLSSLLQSAINE
ncbi:hypothetical protein [Hydrogenophaga taeniospiralis]|uniref:hypothetical protein n=1 Tax=Hydrogenophaga taeniospiralis TaxID=65656 RepID=UPI0012F8A5E1|nr:hypothetical protein [Hydrogenophaga taeniospiralis]